MANWTTFPCPWLTALLAADPLQDWMAAMVRGHCSGLPVVEGPRVVGIITAGDVIMRLRRKILWAAFLMDQTLTRGCGPPAAAQTRARLAALPPKAPIAMTTPWIRPY